MNPVEPRWNELLTLARKHLQEIGVSNSGWVWGGGTVLMLRHEHRLSWDIDLFLNDPQLLSYLSPRLNDSIAEDIDQYSEQGNHLRCFVDDVGEIDYLLVAPVLDMEPELMEIEGHGTLQVMSDREILAQKIYYRGFGFTGRDLFDFATVTTIRPELLEDVELQRIAEIRRNALASRLQSSDLKDGFESVRVHKKATVHLNFDEARHALQVWLGIDPVEPQPETSSGPSI